MQNPNASKKSKELQPTAQSIHICKAQTIIYMYRAKLIKHKNQKRIAVYFETKAELIARFKKLEGATWSNTLKIWHLPDTEEYRKKFKLPAKKHLPTEAQKIIDRSAEEKRKILEKYL